MIAKERKVVNKLKIAIIIFVVALLIVLGGTIGIYAAIQQTIQTSFSIGYTVGQNVAVAVNAKVVKTLTDDDGNILPDNENSTWFEGKFGNNQTPAKQANNLYVLPAAVTDDSKLTLTGAPVTFVDTYVYLCFYFENLNNEYSLNINYSNTIVSDKMNAYSFGGSTESTNEFGTSPDTLPIDSGDVFTVAPGEIYCLYLTLTPKTHNQSALYETTSTTGISFTIQQAG